MNKEEIPVFSWNTETKEFYVLGHKFDGVNSIEDFINYITNLDKENKQLKEKFKATNKGLIKVLDKRLKWKKRYYKEKYIRKELKNWLEENWNQSQDIWFVKIINKIKELEEREFKHE